MHQERTIPDLPCNTERASRRIKWSVGLACSRSRLYTHIYMPGGKLDIAAMAIHDMLCDTLYVCRYVI